MITLLSSCQTTKYLEEDQALLVSNKLEVEGKLDNRRTTTNALKTLYQQTPNTNFIFWPREYFYFRNQETGKDNAFIRWRKRQIDELPAIYDTTLTNESVTTFANYLSTLGYFEAEASYTDTVRSKKAKVDYTVTPGQRYYFKSIEYQTENADILRLLEDSRENALIGPGEPITQATYSAEVNRIVSLLQNNGYAQIQRQDLDKLELIREGYELHAILTIKEETEVEHQVYYFGDVIVDPYFEPTILQHRDVIYDYEGLQFLTDPDTSYVRAPALRNAIVIEPHQIFNKEQVDRTYKNLNNLSAYRFVSVKSRPREGTDTIDYVIQLAPQLKRWVIEPDIEGNLATIGSRRFLVGGGVGLALTNRNFFKGSELFNTTANVFGEFDLRRQNQAFNALNVDVGTTLLIPRFVDGLGIFKSVKNIQWGKEDIWSDESFERFAERTTTQFNFQYNYNFLVDFWRYNSINADYSFNWRPDRRRSIDYTQTSISLFQPTTFNRADSLFKVNRFLENSFRDRLITGFLFKKFGYQYQSRVSPSNFSWNIQGDFELSGAEVHLFNLLLSGAREPVEIANLELAQYFKISFELSATQEFFKKQQLAARIGMGVVRPFGTGKFSTTINVPYISQFIVGGANSVRAWQQRELGPGGYEDPFINPNDPNRSAFYQAGDILFEFGIEYRFDIWWLFEGALFLDGGNIWTVNDERPGAAFSKNFLDQIALGTGFGLRTDFKFFILRIDLGYKLRSPFPDPTTESHIVLRGVNDLNLRNANLNLAIGYPF